MQARGGPSESAARGNPSTEVRAGRGRRGGGMARDYNRGDRVRGKFMVVGGFICSFGTVGYVAIPFLSLLVTPGPLLEGSFGPPP